MISNANELYKIIDSVLCPEGFIRKKDVYYQDHSDLIVAFAVGKAEGAGHYSSVMGCFYKQLLEQKTTFPKFFKSQLRYCLDDFVDEDLVNRVFDLENNEFKGDERELLIKEFVELYVIPFLK